MSDEHTGSNIDEIAGFEDKDLERLDLQAQALLMLMGAENSLASMEKKPSKYAILQLCLNAVADQYHKRFGVDGIGAPLETVREVLGLSDADDDRTLVEDQYRIAAEHPREYVILVGRKVVFHSEDKKLCLEEYQKLFDGELDYHPVAVPPGAKPLDKNHSGVIRGRSLTKYRK